jgi:hypothetical protein
MAMTPHFDFIVEKGCAEYRALVTGCVLRVACCVLRVARYGLRVYMVDWLTGLNKLIE